MSTLDQDKEYLLKNVFPKVQYDNLLEQNIIYLKDYLPLKLTSKQRDLLEQMCKYYDIVLETLPKKLSLYKETSELFKEYDRLKKEISLSTNQTDIDKLKLQALNIRNKLVEGYLEVMYNFITALIPNSENIQDSEDIYQEGYEILIELIERYDINKGIKFIEYLYHYGYDEIINKTRHIGQIQISNSKLLLLITTKERYLKKYGKEPTIEELSRLTDFKQTKIKTLLTLISFLTKNSLESTLEDIEKCEEANNAEELEINKEYPPYTSFFIDDNYEDQIYSITYKELILKLLETLPNNQKEVLILHYGLAGNKCYSLKEIAPKLNLTHQRISLLKEEALNNLRLPIRAKYLQDIINNYTTTIYPCMKDNIHEEPNEKIRKKKLRELEKFLIHFIKKEDLIEIVNTMPHLCRSFSILLFGLFNNPVCTRQEIIQKINLTESRYSILKEKVMRKIITDLRIKYSQGERIISEEELLDYLMTNYLNRGKSKKLERK